MVAEDLSTEPAWRRALERAHALSALLPSALLLWPGPGAPLRGDLLPDLGAAGWAALAAIPAGLGVVLRGAYVGAPATWTYVAWLLIGALSLRLGAPTDSLSASRATLLGLATLACLFAGVSLRAGGRRWMAGGLVALALLAMLPSAFASGEGLAGALGNKAATSEAALAGALVGCVLLAAPGHGARTAGGAAALLFALHAGRAPVLATAFALGLALCAAALLSPRGPQGRGRRIRVAIALGVCVATVAGGRAEQRAHQPGPVAPAGVAVSATGAPPAGQPGLPPRSDVRGLEVRARIAAASLRMLAAQPWLGVGPGQFAAAFPPWRDADEIEISTLGHNLPGQVTEVEHAHDDWLQGVLDTGILGGLAWLAFLVLVGVRTIGALRSQDVVRAALGAGALGLLLEAAARAPLTSNPASACAAFALFGAVSAPQDELRRRSGFARLTIHATLLLLAVHAPRAWEVVRHGRELARLPARAEPATTVLLRALSACPDSVLARALYARLAPLEAASRGAAAVDSVPLWQAVLELRPHHFEAWMELGNAWARGGRLEEGRSAFERALALDPLDPALRLNLARLEVEAGRAEAALGHLAWLEARGRLPAGWIEGAAAEAVRRLDLGTARALLRNEHPAWGELGAQEAWERAQPLGENDQELARTLKAIAHLEWAREQVAAGDPATAARSYRQAQQSLAWRPAGGGAVRLPPAVGMELAAALLVAGRPAEAAQEAERAGAQPRDLTRLPEWAGQALREAGLISR